MNVTKCMNGHFFDADKYQVCPHCGEANTSVAVSCATDEKKSHMPFWGRKKAQTSDNNTVETKDETFGLFVEKENNTTFFEQKEATEVLFDAVATNNVSVCVSCGKEYDATAASCPYCKPSYSTMASLNDEVNVQTVALDMACVSAEDSLQAAVKKAASRNEGKTVGFFSVNNNNVDTCASCDPVVGWLVCIHGKHFGESFNICAGRNAIGRSDSNMIVLAKDDSVSRNKHAWLTYEPKKREFFIQPGDGSGLSYLNGDNILESKKLQAKDMLEFGNGKYILIPLCGEDFTWEDYLDKE